MVRSTSARPSGGLEGVPAKITSDIVPPRSALAPCSPRTQAMASTTLLLPDPFGPPTHVIPGSKCSVVELAKDLNPRRVRLLRCTGLRAGRGRGLRLWRKAARTPSATCVEPTRSPAAQRSRIRHYGDTKFRRTHRCGNRLATISQE